jgi:hypothetical protein
MSMPDSFGATPPHQNAMLYACSIKQSGVFMTICTRVDEFEGLDMKILDFTTLCYSSMSMGHAHAIAIGGTA